MRKIALFCCVLIGLTTSAWAGNEKAEAYLQNIGDQVVSILNNNELTHEQRRDRFQVMLESNFAIKAIAKFTLGKYWRRSTPEEREEFLDLFRRTIVVTYTKRFETHTSEKFVVIGSRQDEDGGVVVFSHLMRPGGQPVKIDWKLYATDGYYKIYDVILDGISMGITQRSEYAAVIQREGGSLAALNKAMRSRLSALSA